MGKASRLKQQSAREKIAAQREAERRAERRRQLMITGTSVIGVLAIVAVFVIIKVTSGGTAASGSAAGTQLAAVSSQIGSVPPSTLDRVGPGAVGSSQYPNPMIKITGSPLQANGKPEVLYMGAEYCPFCATERWAMVVALSRFGTFSNLHYIHSSPSDTPASIPTLTFYKSSYTSKYVAFTPVEMQKIDRSPLQTPTSAQNAILSKYDAPPYVQASSAGAIPFMDFGGKWMISGASYNYQVLQGQTWQQIAAALKDPSSTIAQGADGTANYFTAAICNLTSNQPANVCSSAAVKSLEGKI
jgi:thiol-disulfide isomerase/thioredoxin